MFSLIPWSGRIPTGFRVSRSTWDTSKVTFDFAYEIFTLYDQPFQIVQLSKVNPILKSHNPPRLGFASLGVDDPFNLKPGYSPE